MVWSLILWHKSYLDTKHPKQLLIKIVEIFNRPGPAIICLERRGCVNFLKTRDCVEISRNIFSCHSSDPQPRGVKFRQSRYLTMRAKVSCQSQLMRRAALILLHCSRQTEYPALFMVKENRLNTPLQPTRNILCLDLKTKLKRWHGSPCYYSSVQCTPVSVRM